ncbi:MAG: UDP-4-amino-4,6-dideoxy-N-acetyl-beta-L-altrosamine transaminase [Gammaproteobacteria bacterium]|nr:UDP-4-amino-4,6-dideoxy-N-acetyl-beta-L-altrosamine transaminase [Gammaproteobacteria bacterium]
MTLIALQGGKPVRTSLLPYASQLIDDADIEKVIDVLRSPLITTGAMVQKFEAAIARYVGVEHAVALSSGTAALHAAMFAIGIQSGDEVIVPAITFVASANCIVYQGGRPVFADVDADTLLINPDSVERLITTKTRAIIAVDYAGQACDYESLRRIARHYHLHLISDASHALGGSYKNGRIGSLADLTTFSFHPVKSITTGEGGMVTTRNALFAKYIKQFRHHGINATSAQREKQGSWDYDMQFLGFNYRITDFQCALGLQQLTKLPQWLDRRHSIAAYYNRSFSNLKCVTPLAVLEEDRRTHAYHLYVIKFAMQQLDCTRHELFSAFRAEGIGVNVHYKPVYLHSYYRDALTVKPGHCPTAEHVYNNMMSLPLFPGMAQQDVEDVVSVVKKITKYYAIT